MSRRRTRIGFLATALIAAVAATALAVIADARFMPAYLTALVCWTALPLGALGILLTHRLVGGVWGEDIAAPVDAACRTLPLAGLLFLPVLALLPWIYPWAGAEELHGIRSAYLNQPFFIARTVIYFAIWCTLAFLLSGTGRDTERSAMAAGGLVAYAITVTFAAVDWGMSIEPDFASSVYGWLFISGALLLALAFAVMVLPWLPPDGTALSAEGLDVLAGLLLGLLLFWMYLEFMQYLVIWAGNVPHYVVWYVRRLEGGWALVAAAILVLHGAVPFLLLLWRPIRRHVRRLAAVAALLVVMRFVDLVWTLLPGFGPTGVADLAVLALVLIAVGALFALAFLIALPAGTRRRHAAQAGGAHV